MLNEKEIQAKLAAAESEAQALRAKIEWMETSKFWKLRSVVLGMRGRMRSALGKGALTTVNRPTEGWPFEQLDRVLNQQLKVQASNGNLSSIDGGIEKQFITQLSNVALESFLSFNTTLRLPTSESPKVSIIIVTYNRAELTFSCLRSLCEDQTNAFEVIIVDNNSSDQTPKLLDRIEGATIVRNKENLHFLASVNQAAALAKGEYLLLLNNDAQLLPGSLSAAIRTIESSDDIGAVGGKVILLSGALQEAGSIIWNDGTCFGYGRGDNPCAPMYMFTRDVDYCSGAFLLTKRSLFEELNGLDTAFMPAYYEETDYCVRLWQAGYRIVYDPSVVLLHYEFGSSKKSQDAIALQIKHKDIFVERHRSWLNRQLSPNPASALTARSRVGRERRVLFIDDRIPHVWLGSGFPRTRKILQGLVALGYSVTYYPMQQDAASDNWGTIYSGLPRSVEVMFGNEYGELGLESFLASRQGFYSSILISRPHNMRTFNKSFSRNQDDFSDVKIVYDAEALFSLREVKQSEILGEPIPKEKQTELFQKEIGLTKHASSIITVSKLEASYFLNHTVDKTVAVLGHAVPINLTPNSFGERKNFLFVGSLHDDSSPNADSLIWFMQSVLPLLVQKLGEDFRVCVVGLNKSTKIFQLAAACPQVSLLGKVDDLTSIYNESRVFIAPTRFAAGIPLKICEATSRGLPVVATTLLAAQLGWQPGVDLLAADSPEEFAMNCAELYTNASSWQTIRESAVQRIASEYSEEALTQCLKTLLEA